MRLPARALLLLLLVTPDLIPIPAGATSVFRLPVDLTIRGIGQSVVGEGIVNETGRHQEATLSLKPGATTAFDVVLTNPTSIRTLYFLSGAGSGARFTVEYWGPEGDITSEVTAGAYDLAVDAGSREKFRVYVSVGDAAETGQHRSFWIDATAHDAGVTDRVLATVQVPPIRSWGVNFAGTLRCTAVFPNRSVAPGTLVAPRFTVTNLTSATIDAGGAFGYLIFKDASGTKLWDGGPFEFGPSGPRALGPHETAHLHVVDGTRVRWGGPLTVVPKCGYLKMRMRPVTLRVGAPGAYSTVAEAIDAAVDVPGSPFASCHPGANGEPATGILSTPDGAALPDMTVRCWADVHREDGFDVVGLNLVSPDDLPDVTLEESSNFWNMGGPLPGDGIAEAARWGFVVTTKRVRPYLAMEHARTYPATGETTSYALHDGEWLNWGGGSCGYEGFALAYLGTYFPLDWISGCVPDPGAPRVHGSRHIDLRHGGSVVVGRA
jgi:hypothetical protein